MDSLAPRRSAARVFARSLLGVVLVASLPLAASGPAHSRSVQDSVQVDRQVRYGRPGADVMDVFRPGGHRSRLLPAVLVVHGGGWRFGERHRMEGISRALARNGFAVFNVGYTLAAPGRPGYPRQLGELLDAVRWIRRHAALLGVNPARIGALGSSAGAHLAALLGVAGSGPLDAGGRVRAVVTWSAPFDLPRLRRPALGGAVEAFLGCPPALCPGLAAAASPTTYVSPDDPPMLLVASDHELVPLDQARSMSALLTSARVPHRLWVLPGTRHAREYAGTALGPTVGFLTRRLR